MASLRPQDRRVEVVPTSPCLEGDTVDTVSTNACAPSEVIRPRSAWQRLRSRSPAMQSILYRIEQAAGRTSRVLITGETGTGKEVIAQAIHEASKRADERLEIVDCAALHPTLVASELFGHEKGAFTGADQQYPGAFERAHGGTVFLDEIGELPASVQANLLGALERRSFRRVGGAKPISVDVQVISATHRDLRALAKRGEFREDLYYRVAVLSLEVPPLRERLEDLPLLLESLLIDAGYPGSIERLFPPKAMTELETYAWPGNIRELRNVVEATLVTGEIPQLGGLRNRAAWDDLLSSTQILDLPYSEARQRVVQAFERAYLDRLLAQTRGNVSRAAREAQMTRSYLCDLLKRHALR